MKRICFALALMTTSLPGFAQLLNTDFESWSTTPSVPLGWVQTSGGDPNEGVSFYYPASADAQHGTSALMLSVWYNYTKDAAIQMAPISSRPNALKGYYKYTHNTVWSAAAVDVTDTAQVSVYMSRWNITAGKRDTLGKGLVSLLHRDVYGTFYCGISYTGTLAPDTITVYLDPSMVARADGPWYMAKDSNVASFLTVDNLSLDFGTTGIAAPGMAQRVEVYPNPATDLIGLGAFEGMATLLNLQGQVVGRARVHSRQPLPVGHLAPGCYVLRLEGGEGVSYATFIRQ